MASADIRTKGNEENVRFAARKSPHLLEVNGLKKYFPVIGGLLRKTIGQVKAVDDVSFTVGYGETLGIVGESGCGKSTTGRMIMRVLDPTEGEILLEGRNLLNMHGRKLHEMRRNFQMVFQDPSATLDPRMTVEDIVAQPFIVHKICARGEAKDRALQLLEIVGLHKQDGMRYAHEFSGGQRQRIGIARALALNPKLIVADEAVSALDVSIQSQILNLMSDLRKQFNLSYIFISHNLAVVKHISDRVGVMYLGQLVELSEKHSFYRRPLHPYSQALVSAALEPRRDNGGREQIVLQGDVPSPANPPKGCPFHSRCVHVMDKCRSERPRLMEISSGHAAACHLY